ncbi:MAG: recombinase family protein [Gaiellaceae bacterium]
MRWGTKLIPVDELQRAERRRPARAREQPRARPGRRAAIAPSIVGRIRAEHAAGRSLGQIARGLNTDRVPTAHGGAKWWPSTVRAVLHRSAA